MGMYTTSCGEHANIRPIRKYIHECTYTGTYVDDNTYIYMFTHVHMSGCKYTFIYIHRLGECICKFAKFTVIHKHNQQTSGVPMNMIYIYKWTHCDKYEYMYVHM